MRSRPRRAGGSPAGWWAAVVALLGATLAPASVPAQPTIDLFAATGYDTNPARVTDAAVGESDAVQSDQLEQILWRSELRGRLARATAYSGTFEGGAKRFRDSDAENSLIVRGATAVRQRIGRVLVGSLGLALKDRRQPEERRSYRSGTGHAGLALKGPAGWRFSAMGLLQAYRYLPDERYDHLGWGGGLAATWQRSRFRIRSGVRWVGLEFEGTRALHGGVVDPSSGARADELLRMDLSGSYLGPVVTSVEAYAQRGESNSWGASHVRLGGTGSLAVALPW